MNDLPRITPAGIRRRGRPFRFVCGFLAFLFATALAGCSTTPELTDEFEHTLTLAEDGRSSAQARVGFLFMTGRGVKKNRKQAIRWYSEAAQQGDTDAIDALWEIRGGTPNSRASTFTLPLSRKQPVTKTAKTKISFGDFHALVIGNASYTALAGLNTTTNDAHAVAKLLREDYGYSVTTLIDGTWAEMREALSSYRKTLTEDDNLLIYYAGHGWVDSETEEAYWMPVNAQMDNDIHWISNSTLATTLRGIPARHVMIVADSCFAGTLVRGISIPRTGRGAYIERLNSRRSRTALTSGGVEPVTDSGRNGHSVFANAFLRALTDNYAVVDATTLFADIRRAVVINADQTPSYGNIRKAGHDEGDFLFVRITSPTEEDEE